MISLPIQNQSGEQVGTYEFDPAELADRISRQLLHDVVVMYEANRRQGTVQTKGRGDVAGSTKKLYKQKGTGRARMGPKRTPMRRGGGHCFAKRPQDWSYRLPRKAVTLATRMALLSKFQDNEVTIVDELALDTPKTKYFTKLLSTLGLAQDSCLITIDQHNSVLWKSARNIPRVAIFPASDINAYELLHKKRLLVTKGALDRLRNRKA